MRPRACMAAGMVLPATVLTNPISAREKVIRSAPQETLFIVPVFVAGGEGRVQRDLIGERASGRSHGASPSGIAPSGA